TSHHPNGKVCALLRTADFYKDTLNVQDGQIAEQLAEISRLETLEKGHRVISMGERMEMMPILVTGVLRGYIVDENGRDITDCFIFRRGDVIMGTGDFLTPSPVHIETTTECQVLMVPLAELLQLLDQPELLVIYNQQLMRALERHWQVKMMLYQSDAMTRYQWFRKQYPDLENKITGKHLASFMGMTPVTLSRLRRRLREEMV
ncbi:MAG: cyclic nucleotide-binding domain-containing protein, partial [Clostridia bacterium]|nr:cyclic nucleotide-binding domain-containing protein [Clostridia bacterium]